MQVRTVKDSKNPFTSLKGHAAMEGLFQCEQGGRGWWWWGGVGVGGGVESKNKYSSTKWAEAKCCTWKRKRETLE